jgi:hypothetical protein
MTDSDSARKRWEDISKCILNNRVWERGLDSYGSENDPVGGGEEAFLSTIIKFRLPYKARNFLTM